jgi:predicted permease
MTTSAEQLKGAVEHTTRDLRHAARSLRRSPGFTISAILVLAIGIGSTTAVFSAVNAVLHERTHDGLAIILYRGFPSLSTADYRAIEEQQRSFTAVGGYRGGVAAFRSPTTREPEQVRTARVTTGYFAALELGAAAGRLIQRSDEAVGAPAVAVLGNGFAARTFGSPANALGQQISVDGTSHMVVGVLAPAHQPFATRAEIWTALQLPAPTRRGPFGMQVFARLRPGVTYESATADVTGISRRVSELWGASSGDTARFVASPITETVLATSNRMLRLFGAAVAIVLLIGVANVASLMLVRAIGRSQEVSLRAMLGASRWQLVRLFVAESALLGIAGAAAGVAVGALAIRALIAIGPSMPGLTMAALDARATFFAVGVAIIAAVATGAYPVLSLLRGGTAGLAAGGRTVGSGRGTTIVRSGFVVSQFALALPLLAIAWLLLASFARLLEIDPGFETQNLVTARVTLPSGSYGDDTTMAGYWTRALARVREIPGVTAAGLGGSLPPDDFGASNDNFNLVDRPVANGRPEPNAAWPSVGAGYFDALGLRLLEGRNFTPLDTGTSNSVIVSRSWARTYYPDRSPIGRQMIRGGCTECVPSTVVGVVDDVAYVGLTAPRDAMYSPLTEGWWRTLFLFVRTTHAPEQLIEPVREALRSVDPSIPLQDIRTMDERLYESVAQPRHWALLLGAFAVTAVGLAAIGIFGMLSYAVGTRRREIGVRMALGAGRHAVVRLILASGMAHAAVGTMIGIGGALVATRLVSEGTLTDVSRSDPRVFALVTAVLLGVAAAACWLPARRAANIEPQEALRSD